MQIYHFKCNSCGYEAKLPLGSADLDQTLTDVNADYSEYRLFVCKVEKKFVHADIHDKYFEDECPSDGSKLIEIDQRILPIKCPHCNKDLVTEVSAPLEEQTRQQPT
jgi:DNA-directed RNA polymerase subunit RPC12/RpoP